MGKLDDIPKRNIFDAPEGYFDELPAKIQSRITGRSPHTSGVYRYVWKPALPLLLIIVLAVYYFSKPSIADAESILATVQTSELVQYLDESELHTEDFLESLEYNIEDLEEIENEVYDYDLDDYQAEEHLNIR